MFIIAASEKHLFEIKVGKNETLKNVLTKNGFLISSYYIFKCICLYIFSPQKLLYVLIYFS